MMQADWVVDRVKKKWYGEYRDQMLQFLRSEDFLVKARLVAS
jgi:hypothetical protein